MELNIIVIVVNSFIYTIEYCDCILNQ